MKRKIIEIDQEKCNGCGLCIEACHEGALQLINEKAVLVSDSYCDGLGDCLPECPTDAIRIIEREAAEYDEELVKARQQAKENLQVKNHQTKNQQTEGHPSTKEILPLRSSCSCPGTRATTIKQTPKTTSPAAPEDTTQRPSQLSQWPIQLNLINPNAGYLKNADLLIAADCTAYAYASFHEKFMKDRITMIGCPKLDDNNYYTEKIAEILRNNEPRSIKLVRMDVPCCNGIVRAVKEAMLNARVVVPYSEVVINAEGQIVKEQ